jgi:hypothetical protein
VPDLRKIQFCWYNLVDQSATVISADSENAQFPASNLKDPRSTKVFRSISSSAAVTFDFITTEAVDSILVRGHFTQGFGFNGSLTIKANPTNAGWGSPAFSTTLTPNQQFNLGVLSLASPESYRFWRIEGTGGSFFELADVFIGSSFEPQRNISRQFTFENNDLSRRVRNRYSQSFIDIIGDQKRIRGNINLIDKDNIDEFADFINYVGNHKTFFVIMDQNECIINDFERFSGRFLFRNRPDLDHVINGIYNTSIDIEEAL